MAALVAGGDGTVGSVAAGVLDTELTLGVLPAGTSNDFARSMLLPLSIPEAVRVVAEGRWTRVDVGEANGCVFCHAATAGINSEFAKAAERLRGILGRASYPLAALRVYRKRKRVEFTLTVEGQERRYDAYEIAFVNAPVYGGPLELEVAALELKDRHLRVLIVENISPATILRIIPAVLARRPMQVPGIESMSVTSASIETHPWLPVTVDGEDRTATPCSVRVRPAALRVFASEAFLGPH